MNKKIIVNIAFNCINGDKIFLKKGVNPPRLTKEWIDYRIDIFMKYTYVSLINQTNQSFTTLVYYDETTKDLIEESLSRYPNLQPNIIFTHDVNLQKEYMKGYECVYMVRLDCDDMYHPEFIEKLSNYQHNKSTDILINQEGYVYDAINDKLGRWYHKCAPFFTLIYNVDKYMSGKVKYPITTSHAPFFNYNHEILDSGNYMVIIHEKNTLNKYYHTEYRGDIDDDKERSNILNEFSIIKSAK